jgi:hypothetical protein
VLGAVVFNLDLGLSGPVKELQGQLLDSAQQGDQLPFQLARKGFLLAVLVRAAKQGGVVRDTHHKYSNNFVA